MKTSLKYLAGVSFLTLALIGCGKKEKPESEQIKTKAPTEEVATPEVAPRPLIDCDSPNIKNNVVSAVGDEMLQNALSQVKGKNLEQQLKSRLATTGIEIQNAVYENGECHADLHVVLSEQDVNFINKTLAKERVASLEEQAIESGVALVGANRLVSKFTFNVDGEAVSIDTQNPIFAIASKVLAKAATAINSENRTTARRDNNNAGHQTHIVPPPNVPIRQAPQPQPIPQIQQQSRPPRPENAILQDDDVPKNERQADTVQQVEKTPSEKPATKADKPAETATKTESKPTESKKQHTHNDNTEVTIVEGDDTY